MSRYTPTDITFLQEHLPTKGIQWCSKRLNRHPESMARKAREIGISYTPKMRADEDLNVNPDHFRDIKLPEVAYFLGYFWADGHIHQYRAGSKELLNSRVAIEVQKEDGDHLRRIAETFGRWAVVERQRTRYGVQCKPVLALVISNAPVYQFLKEHGYDDKSLVSPVNIVAKIPPHLRAAFWLGYFDGDGALMASFNKGGGVTMQFAGSYEQDWSAVLDMWEALGVKARVVKQVSRMGHRSSRVNVTRQGDILAFYAYIKPFEHLGLPRKQAKFHLVEDRVRNRD